MKIELTVRQPSIQNTTCLFLLTWNFVDGSERSQNSECPDDGEIVASPYGFLDQAEEKVGKTYMKCKTFFRLSTVSITCEKC